MAKKTTTAQPPPKTHPRSAGKPEVDMGRKIRLRRVEQNMSQQELGDKLGVSFQQVQKYEKGVNRVGAARIEQIAKALDVPVTFFFGNSGNTSNSGKQQSEIESLLFMDSAFSLRLLRAYTAVKDKAVQRGIVALMERIAGISAAVEE